MLMVTIPQPIRKMLARPDFDVTAYAIWLRLNARAETLGHTLSREHFCVQNEENAKNAGFLATRGQNARANAACRESRRISTLIILLGN
jgi:hypothetical protein